MVINLILAPGFNHKIKEIRHWHLKTQDRQGTEVVSAAHFLGGVYSDIKNGQLYSGVYLLFIKNTQG